MRTTLDWSLPNGDAWTSECCFAPFLILQRHFFQFEINQKTLIRYCFEIITEMIPWYAAQCILYYHIWSSNTWCNIKRTFILFMLCIIYGKLSRRLFGSFFCFYLEKKTGMNNFLVHFCKHKAQLLVARLKYGCVLNLWNYFPLCFFLFTHRALCAFYLS